MKVSVIIPVYNSATYIEDCLCSVLNQTMKDFELLLVDDHGKDNSIVVAEAYLLHNVFHAYQILSTPQNIGPGGARNVGMEAARGEYIAFLDSDDLWEPNFLLALTQKADKYHTDLCYCQLQYRTEDMHKGSVVRNPVIKDGFLAKKVREKFLRKFKTYMYCFLYRREFLTHPSEVWQSPLRFPNERSAEDTHFLIKNLLLARSMACVDEPLYIYCLHKQSLTQKNDVYRYESKIKSMNTLIEECRKERIYTSYQSIIDYLWVKKGFVVGALNYLYESPKPNIKVLYNLQELLMQYVPHWGKNSFLLRDIPIYGITYCLSHFPTFSAKILSLLLKRLKLTL